MLHWLNIVPGFDCPSAANRLRDMLLFQVGQKCRSAGRQAGSAMGSGQAGQMGQGQLYELQHGPVPDLALRSQQPHAAYLGKILPGKG